MARCVYGTTVCKLRNQLSGEELMSPEDLYLPERKDAQHEHEQQPQEEQQQEQK